MDKVQKILTTLNSIDKNSQSNNVLETRLINTRFFDLVIKLLITPDEFEDDNDKYLSVIYLLSEMMQKILPKYINDKQRINIEHDKINDLLQDLSDTPFILYQGSDVQNIDYRRVIKTYNKKGVEQILQEFLKAENELDIVKIFLSAEFSDTVRISRKDIPKQGIKWGNSTDYVYYTMIPIPMTTFAQRQNVEFKYWNTIDIQLPPNLSLDEYNKKFFV